MEIFDCFGVLNEGCFSELCFIVGFSIDEIGLMMGGVYGMEVVYLGEEVFV